MRKRLSLVAAALAALFVVAGGAAAAGHFVITSTSQIKPNVIRALRGNQGPRGLRKGSPARKAPQARKDVPGAPGPAGARG